MATFPQKPLLRLVDAGTSAPDGSGGGERATVHIEPARTWRERQRRRERRLGRASTPPPGWPPAAA